MRVVVDTNVFISAALKEDLPPGTALHRAATGHLLLKSKITEQELFVTLERPGLAPLIPPRFRNWLNEVLAAAEPIAITERIAVCRDPKDDKFLELAVNGHADVILTGDGDLLALNPFRKIPIGHARRLRAGRWVSGISYDTATAAFTLSPEKARSSNNRGSTPRRDAVERITIRTRAPILAARGDEAWAMKLDDEA